MGRELSKPLSHQIDDQAQLIFTQAIRPWILNPQSEDYAKDYLVEITTGTTVTGNAFYVQLKGTQGPSIVNNGEFVSFPIDYHHASYWLDRVRDLPVFLVVVDVTNRVSWYLFLQQALQRDQAWRLGKTSNVRIPTENKIVDLQAFAKVVEEAKRWMRRMHPSSIQDAIAAKRDYYKSLDPRAELVINPIDGSAQVKLRPANVSDIKFNFIGPRSDELRQLIDRGQAATLGPGEVLVTGSRAYEDLQRDGGTLQVAYKNPSSLIITTLDQAGQPLECIEGVTGLLEGGIAELRFIGRVPNTPFEISFGPIGNGAGPTLNVNTKFGNWDNFELLNLPFFERWEQFLLSTTLADKLRLTITSAPNYTYSATVQVDGKWMDRVLEVMNWLHQARDKATFIL